MAETRLRSDAYDFARRIRTLRPFTARDHERVKDALRRRIYSFSEFRAACARATDVYDAQLRTMGLLPYDRACSASAALPFPEFGYLGN